MSKSLTSNHVKQPSKQSCIWSNCSHTHTSEFLNHATESFIEETLNHYYSASIVAFLEEFFPTPRNQQSKLKEEEEWESKNANKLKSWRKVMGVKDRQEREMYPMITRLMNFLWEDKELEFRDVHVHPPADDEENDGGKFAHKSGFMGVEKDECSDATMQQYDPFDESNWNQDTEQVLEQVLYSFMNLTYYQHRTASYYILFFPGAARIVRWTPRHIVYTELFDFTSEDEFDDFCHFVRSYGSAGANRGLDCHFIRATAFVAEAAHQIFGARKEELEQAGFSVPRAPDIWVLNLPALSPPNAPCSQPSMQLIVGRISDCCRPSLCGRNGKYFIGYEKEKEESIYFVKANWIYIGEGRASESEVYDKLKKSHYVQEMIYGGHPKDVDDHDYTLKNSSRITASVLELLQTEEESVTSKKKGEPSDAAQRLHFLVLPFVRPFYTFRNAYELVEGIRGGLQGLLDLYRAGYLHRDVSHSNIALARSGDDVKGVLQDFDFAVDLAATRTISHSKTGTHLFLSAALLGTHRHAHQLADDIESFYHILTTHTYPHWFPNRRAKAEQLLKSYDRKDAACMKREELKGDYEGVGEDEIRANIHILGPIISLFRQFLAARYFKEGRFRQVLASDREELVIELCSEIGIPSDSFGEFFQPGFIDALAFDTNDKQEKLLRFLIQVLQIVIKQHKEQLEGMTHNEPNVVDAILRNNNKKRKGEGLESSTSKRLQSMTSLQNYSGLVHFVTARIGNA
ncbi:hypothetical protein BT69DRAFT_1324853 [Atractiella rhizophila]|nr:hypothetical protein BT69DRAFT_1324853 [Atractiella rhizophila]